MTSVHPRQMRGWPRRRRGRGQHDTDQEVLLPSRERYDGRYLDDVRETQMNDVAVLQHSKFYAQTIVVRKNFIPTFRRRRNIVTCAWAEFLRSTVFWESSQ